MVDTSVWVDYFNGKISTATDMLDSCLGEEDVLIGDLILAEVLQGFREERLFKHALELLHAFPIVSMLGPDMTIQSATNYRTLRQNGVTVRKTIDVMIGTYCIAQGLPLLYTDRDFVPMVQHLGLSPAL
jgi:predicted nucleic acid-binding protein